MKTRGNRSTFVAELHSRHARSRDLGAQAAGREPPRDAARLLVPDTRIPLQGLRLRDGRIDYRADEVAIGTATLRNLSTRIHIDAGVLTASPLTAGASGREVQGKIRYDARTDSPTGSIELRIEDLPIDDVFRGKRDVPSMEARLSGTVQGKGSRRFLARAARVGRRQPRSRCSAQAPSANRSPKCWGGLAGDRAGAVAISADDPASLRTGTIRDAWRTARRAGALHRHRSGGHRRNGRRRPGAGSDGPALSRPTQVDAPAPADAAPGARDVLGSRATTGDEAHCRSRRSGVGPRCAGRAGRRGSRLHRSGPRS